MINRFEDIARYTKLLQDLLASPRRPFDGALRRALPSNGGVYRIVESESDEQATMYVGLSSNLQNRIYRSHLMGNRTVSTLKHKLIQNGTYVDEIAVKEYLCAKCSVQFIELEDAAERNLFEHFAIAILRPAFND